MVASSFCSPFLSIRESKFISSMNTQLHFSISFLANAILTVLLLRKGNYLGKKKKAQSKMFFFSFCFPCGAGLQIRFGNLWEILAGQLKRTTFYLSASRSAFLELYSGVNFLAASEEPVLLCTKGVSNQFLLSWHCCLCQGISAQKWFLWPEILELNLPQFRMITTKE